MTDNRNINTEGGNYNENIQGNYTQGNYNKNVNQSRNFQVGDVGEDFNPSNSLIMSDNVENSANVNKTEEQEKPTKKKAEYRNNNWFSWDINKFNQPICKWII